MKQFIVLVILVAFFEVETFSPRNDVLQKAFINISNDLSQRNYLVSVVEGGDSSEKEISALFNSTAGIPHVVARFEKQSKAFHLNSSAIVLLDTVSSLQRFNKDTILPTTFGMSQQLVIFFRNGTFDEISSIKTSRREAPILQYEYFVVEEKKSIRLLTFVYYAPGKCGFEQLVEVNKFDKLTKQWQHENFKIDEPSNLHGCPIKVVFERGMPEFQPVFYWTTEIMTCRGYACTFIRDISSSLNYTFFMFNRLHVEKFPQDRIEIHVQAVFLNYKHSFDPKNELVVTRPVCFFDHFFTVPPGEEYNGYEKMHLPFDEPTWMWIGITFAAAFVTIFVLRFLSHDISNFVQGTFVATPALNVLRAFFGIAQIVCPKRNFARYLLMMFILFSLVMRTAYQGKMFEFLQKEMRKPTVTTVDEMIDSNFTFYVHGGFLALFNDSDLAKRGNVIDNWTAPEFNSAYERAYKAGSKTTVVYFPGMFAWKKTELNITKPPKLLKERYMLEIRGFLFGARQFFFEIFDRKLQQYFEADLVNFNNREWEDVNNIKKYADNKKPFAVLTLSELEAGFVVCLIPFVLIIFVFGLEWMRTLKDLIVFQLILKTYFAVKNFEQKNHSEMIKIKVATLQAIFRQSQLEKTATCTNFDLNASREVAVTKKNAENDALSVYSDDLETWFAVDD